MLERIGETRKAIAHVVGSFTDSREEFWSTAKHSVVYVAGRSWVVLLQGMKSIPGLAQRVWKTVGRKTKPIISPVFWVGFVLMALGLLVGLFRVISRGGTIDEFYANTSTELISIGITVVIIDTLNRFRQDQQLKAQLIRDMGGAVNDFSLRAVRELAHREWLYDGSLNKADLFGANLEGAELFGANLEGAELFGANLERANLKFANLEGANLEGARLSFARLKGANLEEANLKGADLNYANLEGANLEGANLEGAELREAKIDDASRIDDKWLLVWQIVNQGAEGRDLSKANLERANLEGTKLKKADLREADLERADLGGADLERANLEGANLREANLERADLGGANLERANLREANLERADLGGANLGKANLHAAKLWGTDLWNANLGEAEYAYDTEWPAGFDPKEAGAIMSEPGYD